ncbi:hypothetical protein DFH11DRAFT_1741351 [Phellopilus nigrolimitatus]|nr:hypothetical protein DFH11DRAFT_1741351 [Phellopilus nigrolimitatus]
MRDNEKKLFQIYIDRESYVMAAFSPKPNDLLDISALCRNENFLTDRTKRILKKAEGCRIGCANYHQFRLGMLMGARVFRLHRPSVGPGFFELPLLRSCYYASPSDPYARSKYGIPIQTDRSWCAIHDPRNPDSSDILKGVAMHPYPIKAVKNDDLSDTIEREHETDPESSFRCFGGVKGSYASLRFFSDPAFPLAARGTG